MSSFPARRRQVLSKWFPMSLIQYVLRMGEQWSPPDLCARQIQSDGTMVDGGLEFLDNSMDNPTDVFDSTLELDLKMADTKDIDDGAGALDEIRERKSQLEDAFQEIEVKDQQLYEANATIIWEREANVALQAEIARLRAEARAMAQLQSTSTDSTNGPPSLPPSR